MTFDDALYLLSLDTRTSRADPEDPVAVDCRRLWHELRDRERARAEVPDLLPGPGQPLKLLFVGINPGLWTAAVQTHFARPGNRFWPALLKAGFTDRLLAPSEERELLERGYGITNLVARATASASELSNDEYAHGARILERKILRYKPKCVAFLGVGAYRAAFGRPKAVVGRQDERLGGAVASRPAPRRGRFRFRAAR